MMRKSEKKPSLEEDEDLPLPTRKPRWRSLFLFTTKAHYLILFFALILSILSGVLVPALAYFLGQTFQGFTNYGAGKIDAEEFRRIVIRYVIYMVVLGGLHWMLSACFLFSWLVFGELQVKSARYKLYACMLNKEMEWFDLRKAGIRALMPRMQSQLRDFQLATSQPLGFLFQYSSTIIAGIGLAFYSAWDLTLVVIASAPIGAGIISLLERRLGPLVKKQADHLEVSTKHVTAALDAIETVKCANAQQFEIEQYLDTINKAAIYYIKQANINGTQYGIVRFLTLAIFVQGFWYGSYLVQNGKRDSGQVLTAFWSCLIGVQTCEALVSHLFTLQRGRAAGELLYSVVRNVDDAENLGKYELNPEHCDGDVQLQDVSFAYPASPNKQVLDNVSMLFTAGDTTFVVGKSGSGKSTLSSLLLGFYSASGRITIDGRLVDTLNRDWLRNNITVMQQQSVLFNESILKNIAFGLRDFATIGPKDIEECIRYAALEDTVMSFPNGVHTIVGSGGSLISGGQRQRIAFARAKLRDTPILIFDEATSALDRKSSDIIMQSIRQWRKNKTTIIITHDLSQVKPEDYVYVMDCGQVVQEGYRSRLEQMTGTGFRNLLHSDQADQRPLSTIESAPVSPTSVEDMDAVSERPTRSTPRAQPDETRRRTTMATAWSPITKSRQSSAERRISSRHEQSLTQLSTNLSSKRSFTRPMSQVVPDLPSDPIEYSTESSEDYIDEKHRFDSNDGGIDKDKTTEKETTRTTTIPLTKILATIWSNLNPRQRFVLFLGFAAAIGHAAATPVFSWVFSKLLGTYLNTDPNKAAASLQWSMAVLGVALIEGLLSYAMHYLLEMQGQHWIDAIRIKSYARVLDQPMTWFQDDENSTQRLVDCLDRSAEEMRNLLGRFVGLLIVAATMVSIAVVWSLITCWQLTLVGLACGPMICALSSAFNAVNGRWEKRSIEVIQPVSESFTETFGNIRTVRALTLEVYFHHKHSKAVTHAMVVGTQRAVYSGFFFGCSDAVILFTIALLFWYSSILVAYHGIGVQTIMTTVSMLLFTLTSAAGLLTNIPQLNSAREAASSLLALYNLPDHKATISSTKIKPKQLEGSINVSHLTFTYPSRPTLPAIEDLTLNISLDTSTAIIGPSGSGKSTLVGLLLGLHSPSILDSITISNYPLVDIDISTLRNLIALSPQHPPIFPTSIHNNIAYAIPSDSALATSENITRSARLAGITTFISSLPNGYNTLIGEGGSLLSGGQTARIGLARAICRRPRVLILDEPTAGLDGIGKAELVGVVRKLVREGIAVVVVTHDEVLRNGCERVVKLNSSIAGSGSR